MNDRFVNGFFAGIIAAFVTGPLGFAAKHFNWAELQFADFAGLLSLGKVPHTLAENIFATAVDTMVSGALGIVFAYLVPFIGSGYLLFKGWFLTGAFWYIYYPLITIVALEDITINVQTHAINAFLAGLFGLVMARAFYWLYPEGN